MTAPEIRSGWAAVNGVNLFYRSAGNGPTLLLLHAGICDSRMWDDQIGEFGRTHRVIAPDFRGFGQTKMVAGPFAHRHDLRALMDDLGIDRAILVGGSMSGKTTLDFALDNPGRVEALILVASALTGYQFTDAGTRAAWAAGDAALEAGRQDEAAQIEMKTWLAGPRRSLDQIDRSLRQRVRDMLIQSYATPPDLGDDQPLDPPAIGRLQEVRAPTLIIVGDEDQPDIPAIGDLLESGIAGARKIVMRGAAHLPSMEQPAAFNRIVRDFVAGLPRRA
ncbi:MAG TPA: alpha/beta fold hydrolase [Candidatus Acidoferrum sp.]|nr:alpha/beta fold hydrolase [Candidatus Acidoferrum sp.]